MTAQDKIAVFDLEMPSARRDAISAVGITVIENGIMTDSFYSLVNPECSFDPFTVELTGITPEMAAAAPNFAALWETMRPFFEDAVLAAHGASGDLHVLARALMRYEIAWRETVPFLCTQEAARKCFPELERYSLSKICEALEIPLKHHLASSDSTAAAQILLRCMEADAEALAGVREFDMKTARIVGTTPRRGKKKTGAALNIENELKKRRNRKFAAERRLQYRAQENTVLGVKPKALKKFARQIARSQAAYAFLADLPHTYLEEDLLHAYLLNMCTDYARCTREIDRFLPFIENDDVFYALKPGILRHHRQETAALARGWMASSAPYTAAFGVKALSHFVIQADGCFDPADAELVARIPAEHPTVALCAAEYYFRLLKFGGEEAGAYVKAAAEELPAAKRGIYFYEKDAAALQRQEEE